MKVGLYFLDATGSHRNTGTLFTPTSSASLTEAAIHASILTSYSPPLVNTLVLNDTASQLLALYPNDPAIGAPFGTGTQTFGLAAGYKRLAALSECGGRRGRRDC